MTQTRRFQGKRVLITGGTSGIGLATAERLAGEGARVLVTGTNPERIAAAALLFNTSVVRDLGMPGGAIYSSTKGAVRTIVRVLAAELAPDGVRVNAVSPGPIETAFFDRTGMSEEGISGFAGQILGKVPLGRFGAASEVAAVAAFLLSEDASYVTGAEFVVDGGMTQV